MTNKMFRLVYISYFFVALGVFVSVTIPAGFHILAAIPFILMTYKYLKEGNSLPKSAWVLVVYALWGYFTSAMNFSTLADPMRSFGKEKYELFAVMMIPAIFYMQDYMTSWRWRKISTVFFFTIIAAAIYGITRGTLRFDLFKMAEVAIEFSPRNRGFTETMRYGYGTGFVISMMLACIPFLKKEVKVFHSKWFWSALVAAIVGLYFAKTRGAILGVFISLPVIIWFFNKKIAAVMVLIGIIAGGVLGYKITYGGGSSNRLFTRLGNESNLKRFSQYETSFKTFLEKPIIGHGVNQFSSLCSKQKEKYGIFFPDYCRKYPILNCNWDQLPKYCGHSHNIFLENMANRGIVGAGLLIILLIVWGIELWRRQDMMTVIFAAFMSNFVVASQFEYTLNANNSFMIFFLYAVSFAKIPERFKLAK
jgi:O-antigen ligase